MKASPDSAFESFIHRLLQAINFYGTGKWLLYFIFIGIIAGVGAIFFQVLCSIGTHWFLDSLAGYRPLEPSGEPVLFEHTSTEFNRWILLFLPALGGIVSGWIVYSFAPEAEGHGTDAAIRAYHRAGGRIRGRVPLVKTLASAITMTTGGSGGREGPIAQIGAGFGSFLAGKLGLNERERRIMMAAGVGAGVGSIFRAPLAGALFASEVLYKDPEFEADVLIPTGISTVVAYCVFCMVFGWGSLFSAPEFSFSNPIELGPYTVLAFVLIGVSFVYVRTFYGVHEIFSKIPVKPHFKPAMGGLLTGMVGFYLPETLSFGYGIIQQGLFGEVGILLLAGVAFGKILTTSFTISSGGSGGVFGPSVVIGGALGGAVGQVFQQITPEAAPPAGAMVVVGMAGFFTAVSNTPISTIIFVSEMTSSYYLLLPSFLVCLLCYYFSQRWTIFKEQVPNRAASPAHSGEFFFNVLESHHVRDLASQIKQAPTVPRGMKFSEFKKFFCQTSQHYFPIVNSQGELEGIFSNTDFREVLFDPEVEKLLVVDDMATSQIISTNMSEDLHQVMNKFTRKNLDSLPVVDVNNPRKLLGMLRRKEVIAFYNEKVKELSEGSSGLNKLTPGSA
ncbi:MAG: chloride channel protein [Desulfonatronovibrionaceae bacterium]